MTYLGLVHVVDESVPESEYSTSSLSVPFVSCLVLIRDSCEHGFESLRGTLDGDEDAGRLVDGDDGDGGHALERR